MTGKQIKRLWGWAEHECSEDCLHDQFQAHTERRELARALLDEQRCGFSMSADLGRERMRAEKAEAELQIWRIKRIHGVCEEERLAEVAKRVEAEATRDALAAELKKLAEEVLDRHMPGWRKK